MKRESQVFIEYVRKYCISPRQVAEVGVFMPKDSKVAGFISDPGCSVMFIEPQLVCCQALEEAFGHHPNVVIHQAAVMQEQGYVSLHVPRAVKGNPDAGASSYIDGVSSPFLTRTQLYKAEELDTYDVVGYPFSHFDTGHLDALCVDTEGAEWYVIQDMVSRPKVISLEMGGPNQYINEYYEEIVEWMRENNYKESHRSQESIISTDGRFREVFFADIIYVRD